MSPEVSRAGYDWSGFYVGANAGAAFGNSSVDSTFDVTVTPPATRLLNNSFDGDQTAFTGGGILGYNYQMDMIVLGVEADFNYIGLSDDNRRSTVLAGHGGGPDIDVVGKASYETDWYGTIRGRLGVAADNFLIYGTGGVAYGNVSADGSVTATPGGKWKGSSDETNWGWVAGAGVEYGIDKWSMGVEYLYVDLGSDSWSDSATAAGHEFKLKGDADYAFSTVRATVKYRFQ